MIVANRTLRARGVKPGRSVPTRFDRSAASDDEVVFDLCPARYWPVRTAKSSHPNKCGSSSTLVQTLHNETRVVRVARVTPRTRTMLGAINKVKAWGDEKMPELSAKMKELGDKIAPPGGPSKAVPEDPSLIPLRALQRIPSQPGGTPEMRLLVVLQPPEELPAPRLPPGRTTSCKSSATRCS